MDISLWIARIRRRVPRYIRSLVDWFCWQLGIGWKREAEHYWESGGLRWLQCHWVNKRTGVMRIERRILDDDEKWVKP